MVQLLESVTSDFMANASPYNDDVVEKLLKEIDTVLKLDKTTLVSMRNAYIPPCDVMVQEDTAITLLSKKPTAEFMTKAEAALDVTVHREIEKVLLWENVTGNSRKKAFPPLDADVEIMHRETVIVLLLKNVTGDFALNASPFAADTVMFLYVTVLPFATKCGATPVIRKGQISSVVEVAATIVFTKLKEEFSAMETLTSITIFEKVRRNGSNMASLGAAALDDFIWARLTTIVVPGGNQRLDQYRQRRSPAGRRRGSNVPGAVNSKRRTALNCHAQKAYDNRLCRRVGHGDARNADIQHHVALQYHIC